MIDVLNVQEHYLSCFAESESSLAETNPPWLVRVRKEAIAKFEQLGFPSTRHEEWRFTNVAPLTKIPFKPAVLEERDDVYPEELLPRVGFLKPHGKYSIGCHLVSVNGEETSNRLGWDSPGGPIVVADLALVLEPASDGTPKWLKPESIEPYLTRYASYQDNAFTALNTALFRQGALVYVPPNTVVPEPIQLVFVTTPGTDASFSCPRNLIIVGPNSRVSVVESYVGTEEKVYFTNAVTEVVIAQDAVLDYYRLQRESEKAFHVSTVQVRQERGSRFTSHAFAMGGALARTDLNVVLDAEDCDCTLNGLYLVSGDQLIDNHTRIDHAKPRCTSHELYKGILDGRGRGVFNGKIYVHRDAQKTDARQTNKTLLLSDDAVIDAKPQLEIYADDVKCTHGASIGRLDEEAIFYLRTRGIGRDAARRLLTYAFANDIIGRVQIEGLRAALEKAVSAGEPSSSTAG
jgi:Fe-S cluster assembly protein SufD